MLSIFRVLWQTEKAGLIAGVRSGGDRDYELDQLEVLLLCLADPLTALLAAELFHWASSVSRIMMLSTAYRSCRESWMSWRRSWWS